MTVSETSLRVPPWPPVQPLCRLVPGSTQGCVVWPGENEDDQWCHKNLPGSLPPAQRVGRVLLSTETKPKDRTGTSQQLEEEAGQAAPPPGAQGQPGRAALLRPLQGVTMLAGVSGAGRGGAKVSKSWREQRVHHAGWAPPGRRGPASSQKQVTHYRPRRPNSSFTSLWRRTPQEPHVQPGSQQPWPSEEH